VARVTFDSVSKIFSTKNKQENLVAVDNLNLVIPEGLPVAAKPLSCGCWPVLNFPQKEKFF